MKFRAIFIEKNNVFITEKIASYHYYEEWKDIFSQLHGNIIIDCHIFNSYISNSVWHDDYADYNLFFCKDMKEASKYYNKNLTLKYNNKIYECLPIYLEIYDLEKVEYI